MINYQSHTFHGCQYVSTSSTGKLLCLYSTLLRLWTQWPCRLVSTWEGGSPGNSPSRPIRSWLPWLPCDGHTSKSWYWHLKMIEVILLPCRNLQVCTFWWILYGSCVHFSSEENIPFDNTILLGESEEQWYFHPLSRQMEQAIPYCNCYCRHRSLVKIATIVWQAF